MPLAEVLGFAEVGNPKHKEFRWNILFMKLKSSKLWGTSSQLRKSNITTVFGLFMSDFSSSSNYKEKTLYNFAAIQVYA